MDKSEKNQISHRGLALAKLQAWFSEQDEVQPTALPGSDDERA